MIYVDRGVEEPLYQGDVFSGIPLPEFSINDLATPDGVALRWEDHLSSASGPLAAVVQLRPVMAMIISQDCDIARDDDSATLALIDRFSVVHRGLGAASSPKTIQKHITRLSRVHLHWFYLPAGSLFTEKMAVDFHTSIRLDVADLLSMRSRRLGGLNDYAREHLRHRVGYFFQRYAVDEWYSLDREELAAYREEGHPDAAPYPWQEQDE